MLFVQIKNSLVSKFKKHLLEMGGVFGLKIKTTSSDELAVNGEYCLFVL